MKKMAGITVTASALLLVTSAIVLADGTYYPYQSYDEYYRTHSVGPPPGEKPPQPPPPPPSVKPPPPRPEQPIMITEPPEFLFPPGLGFGVAVGVPYDMFYIAKGFYLFSGGNWYQAHAYNGPWMPITAGGLPPELRRQQLSKIHELRNKEFVSYWKDRKHYKGKVYRPGSEYRLPTKSEERERGKANGNGKGKGKKRNNNQGR